MKKFIFLSIGVLLFLIEFSGCNNDEDNDLEKSEYPEHENNNGSDIVDATTSDLKFFLLSDTEAEVTGVINGAANIVIPEKVIVSGKVYTVTRIAKNAFSELNIRLKSVTVPSSVVDIEYSSVFYNCDALTEINVVSENSQFSSVDGILYNKSKTKVLYSPRGKANQITIPSGVTSIEEYAFEGCVNVTSISIPSSVSDMNYLKAFNDCTALTEINVASDNPQFSSVDGVLYDKPQTKVLYSPRGKANQITIPSGVTSIEEYAFKGCVNVTSISIPMSVSNIGIEAFRGCSGLTEITIPAEVSTIKENTFSGCSNLKSIEIPVNVTSIGDYAFGGCVNLDVTINNNVNNMNVNLSTAFMNTKSVTYYGNITSITAIEGDVYKISNSKLGISNIPLYIDKVDETRITISFLGSSITVGSGNQDKSYVIYEQSKGVYAASMREALECPSNVLLICSANSRLKSGTEGMSAEIRTRAGETLFENQIQKRKF